MQGLLYASRAIDALNERVGRAVIWLVLVAVLVSSVNATVRKLFDISSNAFLELQWYLFSAIFLLCAGYALLHNAHVRIDVLSGHLSPRGRAWIDVFGCIAFLLPMAAMMAWLSWPLFIHALASNEHSPNAGGLLLWPVRLLPPIGFALLALQGISELIKRVAFLMGLIPDPLEKAHVTTAEEELATQIKVHAGTKP